MQQLTKQQLQEQMLQFTKKAFKSNEKYIQVTAGEVKTNVLVMSNYGLLQIQVPVLAHQQGPTNIRCMQTVVAVEWINKDDIDGW